MEEISWVRLSRTREIPPGVEKQDSSPEIVHDESIETWQNELCNCVSFVATSCSIIESIFFYFYTCNWIFLHFSSRAFIEEKLGSKYVEGRTLEFSKSFEETSPSTPIFFILSPGVNPLKVNKMIFSNKNVINWNKIFRTFS